MTPQTANEIAREVEAEIEEAAGYPTLAAKVRAGERDDTISVNAAQLIQARLTAEHQAAVAELVEGLEMGIRGHYPVSSAINERGHDWCEAYLDEWLPIAKALIAKHRAPDAFDTWAEGLIDE